MHAQSTQDAFFASVSGLREILQLFEALDDVHLYVKDADGRFMIVNEASLARHGLGTVADIIGKTDHDLHPPLMAEAYRAEDLRVMSDRTPAWRKLWLVYDHLHVQRWFVSTKVPLLDANGEVVGIAGAMQPVSELEKAPSLNPVLAKAMQYVLDHFSGPLKMTDLAKAVGISISQLDRQFRAQFDMTPSQYLLKVRINAARVELSRSSETIGDIAIRCGFYDQAQFGKLFKRTTGLTPGEYRRRF